MEAAAIRTVDGLPFNLSLQRTSTRGVLRGEAPAGNRRLRFYVVVNREVPAGLWRYAKVNSESPRLVVRPVTPGYIVLSPFSLGQEQGRERRLEIIVAVEQGLCKQTTGHGCQV
jgi:hypothetical protein